MRKRNRWGGEFISSFVPENERIRKEGRQMNIIYLQCDTRYNQWMLEKIDKSSVIEHTIRRCKAIGLENGGG